MKGLGFQALETTLISDMSTVPNKVVCMKHCACEVKMLLRLHPRPGRIDTLASTICIALYFYARLSFGLCESNSMKYQSNNVILPVDSIDDTFNRRYMPSM